MHVDAALGLPGHAGMELGASQAAQGQGPVQHAEALLHNQVALDLGNALKQVGHGSASGRWFLASASFSRPGKWMKWAMAWLTASTPAPPMARPRPSLAEAAEPCE